MTEAQAIADSLIETERLRLLNLNSLFSDVYQQLILIDRDEYGEQRFTTIYDDSFTSFKNLTVNVDRTKINFGHMNNRFLGKQLASTNPMHIYEIDVDKLFETFTIGNEKRANIPYVGFKINFKELVGRYQSPILHEIVESFYNKTIFENPDTENTKTHRIKIFKHKDHDYQRYVVFFDKIIKGVFKFENHDVIDLIPDECIKDEIVRFSGIKSTVLKSDKVINVSNSEINISINQLSISENNENEMKQLENKISKVEIDLNEVKDNMDIVKIDLNEVKDDMDIVESKISENDSKISKVESKQIRDKEEVLSIFKEENDKTNIKVENVQINFKNVTDDIKDQLKEK